jgi:hypothetical protein
LGSVADVDDSFAVASSSSSLDRARGAYARVGRRVVGRRRDARDARVARVVVVGVVVDDIARMVAVGAKCGRAIDRSIDRSTRARAIDGARFDGDRRRARGRSTRGRFFRSARVDEC